MHNYLNSEECLHEYVLFFSIICDRNSMKCKNWNLRSYKIQFCKSIKSCTTKQVCSTSGGLYPKIVVLPLRKLVPIFCMYDFFSFPISILCWKAQIHFFKSFPILIIQLLENRSDSKSTLICTGFSAFYIWRIRVTVGSKSENRANNLFSVKSIFTKNFCENDFTFLRILAQRVIILRSYLKIQLLWHLNTCTTYTTEKKLRFFDLVPQILGKYRI